MLNSIEKNMDSRRNNFNFIRFVAASFVILSHCFSLSANNMEIFAILTNGQNTLGGLAIDTFFLISGFLITQSYDRTPNIIIYAKSRILRIFPALAFVLVVSVFILGPIVTRLSISEYFHHPMTYGYLKGIWMHKLPYNLPGVFEKNLYPNAVNGSLWSLEFEFLCYIVLGILGVFRLLKKEFILILFAFIWIGTKFIHVGDYYFTSRISIEVFSFFAVGMLFYAYRKYIPLNKYLFLSSIIIMSIGAAYGHFIWLSVLFGSYSVMYLSFLPTERLWNFAKFGDFSYGIYIFAFPVQQTVVMLLGNTVNPTKLFLFSYPITLLLSVISWHLVEKNALKLKNIVLFKSTQPKGIVEN